MSACHSIGGALSCAGSLLAEGPVGTTEDSEGCEASHKAQECQAQRGPTSGAIQVVTCAPWLHVPAAWSRPPP